MTWLKRKMRNGTPGQMLVRPGSTKTPLLNRMDAIAEETSASNDIVNASKQVLLPLFNLFI